MVNKDSDCFSNCEVYMTEVLEVVGLILAVLLVSSLGVAFLVRSICHCPQCGQFDEVGFEEAIQQICLTDYDYPYQYRSFPVVGEHKCKGCGHSFSVVAH